MLFCVINEYGYWTTINKERTENLDCVECQSKIPTPAPTATKRFIMTPDGMVETIVCKDCGRVHNKENGKGFDECSGKQYFRFPGDPTWTLKSPA